MKEPANGHKISKAWLEEVLSQHLEANPAPLTVHSFTVTGLDPGDGLNSELVLVRVEASRAGESTPVTHHLAAKFLSMDPNTREVNRKLKVPLREYFMYKEIIPYLNQHQASVALDLPPIQVPRLIYSKCTAKQYVLLFENIQTLGYRTNDKLSGLDFQHLKVAVEQIARLHAVSYVCNNIEDFRKKYPGLGTTQAYIRPFEPLMDVMLDNCITFLKEFSDMSNIIKKLKTFKRGYFTRCLSASSESPITCLNHGDFWNNNLMYKYAETGGEQHIEAVQLIDLGNCSLGSPMFDLQYLMHTSTTRAVRDAHLDDLLHHYHSTFITVTQRFNASPTHWTFDHFKAEWDKTYILGFCIGVALVQGTLSREYALNQVKSESEGSSVLSPVKTVVGGVRQGFARLMVPILFTSVGLTVMKNMFKILTRPVLKELKSGKNPAMNSRLIGIIQEANDKGFFD